MAVRVASLLVGLVRLVRNQLAALDGRGGVEAGGLEGHAVVSLYILAIRGRFAGSVHTVRIIAAGAKPLDLFAFKRRGIDEEGNVIGEHTATGVRPLFADILEAEGYKLSADIFIPSSQEPVGVI